MKIAIIGNPGSGKSTVASKLHDILGISLYHLDQFDNGTWACGRAWALWKALIIAAGVTQTNAVEGEQCWRIIDEIIADHKDEAERVIVSSCKK